MALEMLNLILKMELITRERQIRERERGSKCAYLALKPGNYNRV